MLILLRFSFGIQFANHSLMNWKNLTQRCKVWKAQMEKVKRQNKKVFYKSLRLCSFALKNCKNLK